LGFALIDVDDTVCTSQSVLAMIQSAEPTRRSRAVAELVVAAQLQTPAGERGLLEAATQRVEALTGMHTCTGGLHRSFWLYVHHRDLFDAACAMEYLDTHSGQAQQFSTNVKKRPSDDGIAQQGFCWATGVLYQSQMGCGEQVICQLIARSDDVFLLTAYVQDLATLQLEFEGEKLARRVGHPTIHMVLEYSASTGICRVLVKGGAKFQQGLVRNFAKHYLNADIDAKKIKPTALNLTKLRQGVQLPKTNDLGFVAAMVKELTVLSDDRALKLCCTAAVASDRTGVTDLLKTHLPTDNPMARNWQVVSATINLYLQQPGKARTRTVAVEVTSQGRLNLHKYEPAVQDALESYLVELGVMHHGDTLIPITAHEQASQHGAMH
jgi:hypothetical protein